MKNFANFAMELRTIAEFEFDTSYAVREEIQAKLGDSPEVLRLLKLIYVAGAQLGSIKTLEMLKRDLKV